MTPTYRATSKIYMLSTDSAINLADLQLANNLNGDYQDVVKNGQSVTMRTELKYNVLSVHYNADSAARSIEFEARPGGDVQIELKYTGAVLTVVSR